MTTTYILGDNAPRKSNFDPDLARKLTKYYKEHPEALIEAPGIHPAQTNNSIKQPIGECILMPETGTYALGVHVLQEVCTKENNQNQPKFNLPDGKTVYRPLTFKENCLARMHQFNTLTNADGSERTLEQRTELMLAWNNSCCGIAYPNEKRKSNKFKLTLRSPELISLPKDFDKGSIFGDYDSFNYDLQLDRNEAKYNQELTSVEIDSHEGWLALFENDTAALRDCYKMVEGAFGLRFPCTFQYKFMAFNLLSVPANDSLRDVRFMNSGSYFGASGNGSLYNTFFLRRKP